MFEWACYWIGGSTKRDVMKASLKRPNDNQILTAELMYRFCQGNAPGIQFIFVTSEEVWHYKNELIVAYEY